MWLHDWSPHVPWCACMRTPVLLPYLSLCWTDATGLKCASHQGILTCCCFMKWLRPRARKVVPARLLYFSSTLLFPISFTFPPLFTTIPWLPSLCCVWFQVLVCSYENKGQHSASLIYSKELLEFRTVQVLKDSRSTSSERVTLCHTASLHICYVWTFRFLVWKNNI